MSGERGGPSPEEMGLTKEQIDSIVEEFRAEGASGHNTEIDGEDISDILQAVEAVTLSPDALDAQVTEYFKKQSALAAEYGRSEINLTIKDLNDKFEASNDPEDKAKLYATIENFVLSEPDQKFLAADRIEDLIHVNKLLVLTKYGLVQSPGYIPLKNSEQRLGKMHNKLLERALDVAVKKGKRSSLSISRKMRTVTELSSPDTAPMVYDRLHEIALAENAERDRANGIESPPASDAEPEPDRAVEPETKPRDLNDLTLPDLDLSTEAGRRFAELRSDPIEAKQGSVDAKFTEAIRRVDEACQDKQAMIKLVMAYHQGPDNFESSPQFLEITGKLEAATEIPDEKRRLKPDQITPWYDQAGSMVDKGGRASMFWEDVIALKRVGKLDQSQETYIDIFEHIAPKVQNRNRLYVQKRQAGRRARPKS